jgi:dipeptidyl aminopeptidase/acylaminoacyl peptidase
MYQRMKWQNQRRAVPALVLALTLLPLQPPAEAQSARQGPPVAASTTFTVDDLLDVVNLTAADLSADGRWLAVTAGSLRERIGIDNHRFGDPSYVAPTASEVRVIDTRTGKGQTLFSGKRQVRGLQWSPDGSRLALLVRRGEAFEPMIWERETGRLRAVSVPRGKTVAENAELQWSADGARLLLPLRAGDWGQKTHERFLKDTRERVIVLSSKDPFLSWEDLRRAALDQSLAVHDLRRGETREILPEMKLRSYAISEDGSFLTYQEDITQKTDYDVIFGSENKVQVLPLGGGEPRTVISSTKGITPIWSRQGRHYAYAKEGNLFFGSIEGGEPRQLTGKAEDKTTESAEAPADGAEKKEEGEQFSVVRLSPWGEWLVASSKQGLWLIDTASGERELFLKMPEEDKEGPRYQAIEWSPDGEYLYLTYASRTEWERGLARYSLRQKRLETLLKDSRLYSDFRLSKDGRTWVFSASDGNRPSDLYAADADLQNVRRLTDANPQLREKQLAMTELISYLDVDGNRLYGVLYYPTDYQPGKKYPTVFNLYEQFFDDRFSGTIDVLTANGYAVMQPSVNLEIGFPGEAWVKGVTAAANKLIEMGVADPERLGVQGTSYGGYATNLLIAQTGRFKAAVNISGKVNMVSFYTDSPRLGVRNIHAPEKSQDRLGATLWEQPQKYIQHSAIMFADRIKTPLLLITGEQDHNVPARQAMEMFYALRRLDREVEWVNYIHGGHGMPTTTVEEVRDYHERILAWYDKHLKSEKKQGEAPEPVARR